MSQLPLSANVNLEVIASMTEGFSGADLQALLSDAQLASVHELLDREASDKRDKIPVIDDVLLKSVASKTRPSVSEAEKRRLYGIYSQFLDSKKSVAAQVFPMCLLCIFTPNLLLCYLHVFIYVSAETEFSLYFLMIFQIVHRTEITTVMAREWKVVIFHISITLFCDI